MILKYCRSIFGLEIKEKEKCDCGRKFCYKDLCYRTHFLTKLN